MFVTDNNSHLFNLAQKRPFKNAIIHSSLVSYVKYSLSEMEMFHNNVTNLVKFSVKTYQTISNLSFYVDV